MNKTSKKSPQVKVLKEVPTGPFHFKGRQFHYGLILSIIAFCFIIYGNNIRNGFSLDDEFVLHGDTVVHKGFKGIPELFKMRYAWDQKGDYGYRPLVKVSYAIECQIFGDSPHIGHFLDNLLYAFLCIFLFYLLRKLFYNEVSDYFLFVVMAIFICHPMHTEVVDSLKNRDILMVCLFGFYAVYAFIKAFETDNKLKKSLWLASAMLSFDLGFLSKPDELLFIAIIPLVVFFYHKNSWKKAIFSVLFLLAARILLLVFIKHELPHHTYTRTFIFIEQPLLHTHWFQRISLGLYAIWFYMRKLIFPVKMVCYYGYKEINPSPSLSDINVLIGAAIAIVWLYLVFRNKNNRGILLFSLLYLGGTLFAYLDIVQVGPGIFADRFTFIPSLGFALAAAMLIYHLLKLPLKIKPYGAGSRSLYITLGIVCIAYSARTINRNPDWFSHLSVYRHDVKLAPKSAKLQSLTAAACIQEIQENPGLSNDEKVKLYKRAEQGYLASIEIFPEYTTSLNNEGMIQYNFYRNLNKAIEYFTRAISFDSNYTEALFNTGAAYEQLGKKELAEQYYLRAIKSNPKYWITYVYLSKLYFSEGRLDKVLQFNQDALNNGHISDVLYVNMGNAYMAMRDTIKAVGCFEKAVAMFSKNIYLEDVLTRYYAKKDPAKSNYYARLSAEAKQQRALAGQRRD